MDKNPENMSRLFNRMLERMLEPHHPKLPNGLSFALPESPSLPPRPVKELTGDYEYVEEIFQNEYGITLNDEPKPVLVTYGLLNCVGVVGFEEAQRIGFLAHLQVNTDIPSFFGELLYRLSLITQGRNVEFQVKLAGGLEGDSNLLIDSLKARLSQRLRDDIRFSIVEQDILSHDFKGKDLGIDTKEGSFINGYHPLSNRLRRERYPSEIQELFFHSRHPILHYYPYKT